MTAAERYPNLAYRAGERRDELDAEAASALAEIDRLRADVAHYRALATGALTAIDEGTTRRAAEHNRE